MGKNSVRFYDAILYTILDTGYVAPGDMFAKCRALIESGSKVIQLRAKKETSKTRRQMALEILPLFESPNSPTLIINDDIELAAELPNVGLHIGQDDIPPCRARQIIGPDKPLGLSTHSLIEAKSAEALRDVLDYFAVGPVYATQTKPGRKAVGLELVRLVADFAPTLPWFAIGGVNMKTLKDVALTGAERIVAVSEILLAKDSANFAANMQKEFLNCKR